MRKHTGGQCTSFKLAICFPRLYVSPQFLTKLYQKASAKQLDGQYTDDERKIHGMAFGTVVAFIEESLNNADEEFLCLRCLIWSRCT